MQPVAPHEFRSGVQAPRALLAVEYRTVLEQLEAKPVEPPREAPEVEFFGEAYPALFFFCKISPNISLSFLFRIC